jgi:large repetitive protein
VASSPSNAVTPSSGSAIPLTITSANKATFTAGTSGTFKFSANGSPTPTYSEAGMLPSGVALSATGVLSGTPAIGTNGIYPITVTAANGVLPDARQSFTLYVGLLVTTTSLPVAYVGPYSATLTAVGGNAPYKWSKFGNLPPGLRLKKSTGVIFGTPKAAGIYTFTVRVVDTRTKTKPAVRHIATKVLSITVPYSDAPVITSAASTGFASGQFDTFTVTALGKPAPKLQETGSLPSGVNFTDNGNGTGQLAGTPAGGTTGTYPITITASNGIAPSSAQKFTLSINGAPSIVSAAEAIFTAGSPGVFDFLADGSPAPTFTESGALPSGVTLSAGGVLSGVPALGTNGVYPITVTAANGVLPDAIQSFTLYVGLLVTTPSLPAGSVKVDYGYTLQAIGGNKPYKWVLFGALPPGLHLKKSTGAITGTPKTAGTYTFTVEVSDTKSTTTPPTQHTATQILSITIR